jgi:hypothetical protein
MVKTGGAKQKAQTHFEQVPLKVVEKVLRREAVNGGTGRLRETAAKNDQAAQPGRFDR